MMTALINEIPDSLVSAWRDYLGSIEDAINKLEIEINQLTIVGNCSATWCRKTETIISELDRSLNALENSPWINKGDLTHLANLKMLISDLYSSYYTASRIS